MQLQDGGDAWKQVKGRRGAKQIWIEQGMFQNKNVSTCVGGGKIENGGAQIQAAQAVVVFESLQFTRGGETDVESS